MQTFKVGDSAVATGVAAAYALDITAGNQYEVLAVTVLIDGRQYIEFVDDAGDRFERPSELFTVFKAEEYIINGSSGLFTSMEDAEAYAKANYTGGQTVEIAQVIKRVIVKRTVSISLELA